MKLKEYKNFYYQNRNSYSKTKETILFIHGFATTSDYFKNFSKNFSQYNYLALELPGAGVSKDKNYTKLSVDFLVEYCIDFIKAMNLKDFILIGHSMGGGISSIISSKIPGLIKETILITPMNHSICFKSLNVLKFNFSSIKKTQKFQQALYFNSSKYLDDKKIEKEFEYQYKIKKNIKPLLKSMSSFKNRLQLKKAYNSIQIPTLLILTNNDFIICSKHTGKKVRKNNNIQVETIDKCGHLPFEEKKDTCFKIINKFLN